MPLHLSLMYKLNNNGLKGFPCWKLIIIEEMCYLVINFDSTFCFTINLFYKFGEVSIYPFVFQFSKEPVMPN